jgi:hypothetical protein
MELAERPPLSLKMLEIVRVGGLVPYWREHR